MPIILSLEQSIGNPDWVIQNEKALKELFPEDWVHFSQLSADEISNRLQCLRVELLDDDRLMKALRFFLHLGIADVDGAMVRRGQRAVKDVLASYKGRR